MNETRDRIIERIRRCLALGDSSRNPSEHEAETAIRIAKNLMDQYNLDMADIVSNDGTIGGRIVEGYASPNKKATPPQWECDLCKVCNALFSLYSFRRRGAWNEGDKMVFVGEEQDVAIGQEVYKLLKLEVMALGSKWEREERATTTTEQWNNHLSDGQWRTRRWKYQEGVVWNLISRATAASEELSKANAEKVKALVVRKADNAREWAKKEYNLHPSIRRESGLHSDAWNKGNQDGAKLSLNFKKATHGGSSKPLALP